MPPTSMFSDGDLEIATKVFALIVGDNPARALALAPVCQWSAGYWTDHASALLACGFDRLRPGHLTALQWLLDRACDEAPRKGT